MFLLPEVYFTNASGVFEVISNYFSKLMILISDLVTLITVKTVIRVRFAIDFSL